MSAETHKAMLRRVMDEAVTRGNLAVVDELVAPGYVNHNLPAPAPGPDGFKQIIQLFRGAFPDIRVTLDDVIVEGDKVASRGFWQGAHRGEFMGVPATGKQVRVAYLDIWRVEDGKFVENWVQMDLLGLLQQLGVAPQPEPATV